MTERPAGLWRLSLRELLVVVVLLAVVCVALKSATPLLADLCTTAVLLVMATMTILALIGRGRWQAFAIGFVIWGLLFWVASWQAVRGPGNLLPTDAFADWAHQRVAVPYDFDPETGTILGPTAGRDNREGPTAEVELSTSFPSMPFSSPFSPEILREVELPGEVEFASILDVGWTLALAYLGGRFAVWVYQRRVSQQGINSEGQPL